MNKKQQQININSQPFPVISWGAKLIQNHAHDGRIFFIHFWWNCCLCQSSDATTHQFVVSSSRGNDLWKLSCLLLLVVLLVVHLENESWMLSQVVHQTQAYIDLKQCITVSPHAHHIPAHGERRQPAKPNCEKDTSVQWSHISVTLWTRQKCPVISHISHAVNKIQVYSDLTHQSCCDLTCQSCCEQDTGAQWFHTTRHRCTVISNTPLGERETLLQVNPDPILLYTDQRHTSTNSSQQ